MSTSHSVTLRRRSRERPRRIAMAAAALLTLSLLGAALRPGRSAYASAAPAARGDGTLRLYSYHLDEVAEIVFRRPDGTIAESGLARIERMFRSRDADQQRGIDPRLVDLLDHLQDHFGADTIEIISGYRSAAFNEKLRSEGHSVAPESLHVRGMAADIHIDEVREETLRDYARQLPAGGVGYYGPLDFVHVDIGRVRTWQEPGAGKRKLVGVLAEDAATQLTSDANDYLPGQPLRFRWTGPIPTGPAPVQLEHFSRGTWTPLGDAPPAARERAFEVAPTDPLLRAGNAPRYGKYRWIFRSDESAAPLSSNEFYLKRS